MTCLQCNVIVHCFCVIPTLLLCTIWYYCTCVYNIHTYISYIINILLLAVAASKTFLKSLKRKKISLENDGN